MGKGGKGGRVLLDESQPHTLAKFIEESLHYELEVVGLPEEVSPEEAVEVFGKMRNIHLKLQPVGARYFHGFFYREGTKVVSTDGTHLFTMRLVEMEGERGKKKRGCQLTVEPAALELLRQHQGGQN